MAGRDDKRLLALEPFDHAAPSRSAAALMPTSARRRATSGACSAAGRVVDVDDAIRPPAARWSKQLGLGPMIVGQRLVIVEMVAPQIRQADVAKLDAGDARSAKWRGSKLPSRRASPDWPPCGRANWRGRGHAASLDRQLHGRPNRRSRGCPEFRSDSRPPERSRRSVAGGSLAVGTGDADHTELLAGVAGQWLANVGQRFA